MLTQLVCWGTKSIILLNSQTHFSLVSLLVHSHGEVPHVATAIADGPVGPVPPYHRHALVVLLLHGFHAHLVVDGEVALCDVALQALLAHH